MCLSVHYMRGWFLGSLKGSWKTLWNWSERWLWTTMWVLGTELGCLEEQSVFFIAEPFLFPQIFVLFKHNFLNLWWFVTWYLRVSTEVKKYYWLASRGQREQAIAHPPSRDAWKKHREGSGVGRWHLLSRKEKYGYKYITVHVFSNKPKQM